MLRYLQIELLPNGRAWILKSLYPNNTFKILKPRNFRWGKIYKWICLRNTITNPSILVGGRSILSKICASFVSSGSLYWSQYLQSAFYFCSGNFLLSVDQYPSIENFKYKDNEWYREPIRNKPHSFNGARPLRLFGLQTAFLRISWVPSWCSKWRCIPWRGVSCPWSPRSAPGCSEVRGSSRSVFFGWTIPVIEDRVSKK